MLDKSGSSTHQIHHRRSQNTSARLGDVPLQAVLSVGPRTFTTQQTRNAAKLRTQGAQDRVNALQPIHKQPGDAVRTLFVVFYATPSLAHFIACGHGIFAIEFPRQIASNGSAARGHLWIRI